MEIGAYVSCVKPHSCGLNELLYGRIIAIRISKYNRQQKFYSIKTRCGVYSSSDLLNIRELNEKQKAELTYFDLNPKKGKKNKEYKKLKKQKKVA